MRLLRVPKRIDDARMLYRAGIATLLVGCATAGPGGGGGGDKPDADRGSGGGSDAAVAVDADIDAPPHIDASGQCTPMPSELLVNGMFDAAGGWTATPIVAGDNLITNNNGTSGVSPKSAPNNVWMGGVAQANANDSLYQDVMVPAGTTKLEVTGFYWTRSSDVTTAVYDSGKLELLTAGGQVIDTALSVDNTKTHTAWQSLAHTFAMGPSLSGQTVRLRFSTHNDTAFVTSFWFDSFSLQATHCM